MHLLAAAAVTVVAIVGTITMVDSGSGSSSELRFLGITGLPITIPRYSPYYYPQAVVVPTEPPVYVEQGQAPAPAQTQSGYWYYCREANAYYPHVDQCAGQWERVPPRPPS